MLNAFAARVFVEHVSLILATRPKLRLYDLLWIYRCFTMNLLYSLLYNESTTNRTRGVRDLTGHSL